MARGVGASLRSVRMFRAAACGPVVGVLVFLSACGSPGVGDRVTRARVPGVGLIDGYVRPTDRIAPGVRVPSANEVPGHADPLEKPIRRLLANDLDRVEGPSRTVATIKADVQKLPRLVWAPLGRGGGAERSPYPLVIALCGSAQADTPHAAFLIRAVGGQPDQGDQRRRLYHFARFIIWIARRSHQAPALAGPPLHAPFE